MSALIARYRLISSTTRMCLAAVAIFVLAFLGIHAADKIRGNTAKDIADSDGDGASDSEELIAGTNPNDSNSVFRMVGPPVEISNGVWRVTWSSVPGKIYHVQRAIADQLDATSWLDLAEITASGSIASFEDTNSTARLYRVRLDPPLAPPASGDMSRNPGYFVPLDPQGNPINGSLVPRNPDGSLPAFEFRPAGPSSAGAGQGVFLRFASGARIGTNGGAQTIDFATATAGFGPRSLFQLAQPLTISNAAIRTVPTTGLDVSTLLAAFGQNPSNGLEVILYGKFRMKIMSGTFTEQGLQGARIVLLDSSLPLPDGVHSYANFVLELEPGGSIRIPFSGEFGFDDGSGHGAQLRVPPARPLWLELRADGGIGIGGRADLKFTPGPEFSVDFLFDEPSYELSMSAKGLHLSLVQALSGLLPAVPTVPDSDDPAVLAQRTEQLRCYENALARLTGVARADTPFGMDEPAAWPAEETSEPASMLDAWSYAALCGSNLDASALSNAVAHAGPAASAARGIKAALDLRLALLRIKFAFQSGGFAANASIEAVLDEAIVETTAAVVRLAREPGAVRTLAAFSAVAQCMRAQHELQQQLNLTPDSVLNAALEVLLQSFTTAFTQQLGIAPAVFVAPAGSRIAAMSRAETSLTLTQVVGIISVAQQIGLDETIMAPTGETIAQLATRLWTLTSAELSAAEASPDSAAFMHALDDVLDIIAIVQSGIVPSAALAQLPNADTLNSLSTRLGAVLQAELQRQAASASTRAGGAKIVGGHSSALPIPYQVALVEGGYDETGMRDQAFCGGTILNSSWILTAGHCVTNSLRQPSGVMVAVANLGSGGHTAANYYPIAEIIVHPFYTNATTDRVSEDYDIALLRLGRPINFDALNPEPLVYAEEIPILTAAQGALGAPALNAPARASGWGLLDNNGTPPPQQLQYIDLPISTNGHWRQEQITRRMLTAGFTAPGSSGNICSGDSGGPLVVNDVLVGVASFVSVNGCAAPGFPGVFVRVSPFEPWIKSYADNARVRNVLAAIKALDRIARHIPVEDHRIQALYHRAEAQLAYAALNARTLSFAELAEMLELGNAFARIRNGNDFDTPSWWEDVVLRQIVQAMRDQATEENQSKLLSAIRMLLRQADRVREDGGNTEHVKQYIVQAQSLAFAAAEEGQKIVDRYLARIRSTVANGPGAPSGESEAKDNDEDDTLVPDIRLPGDIYVDRVAGAVSYNRETRDFSGAFSGELRLPAHDLSLTINNASIGSGGAFNLSAYGSVAFPPGNSQGQFIIPAARPLHVSGKIGGRVNFSGAGRVQLNNGMAFEAFLQLEDPLYRFGLSAEGIRFDFADSLRVMVPTLPDGQQFTANVTRDLNDYFRSLSATIDSARDATKLPLLREPGQPPEFSVPIATFPGDDLEAWANARIADAHLNVTRDYAATLESAKQNLKTLAGFLRQRRGDISPEELEMRLRILGKVCASIQAREAAGETSEANAIAMSPEFQEFLHETEAAVLALLQRAPTRDEVYQEAALESVNKFQAWGACLDESARLRVIAALENYQQGLWTAFAISNGISPTTGLVIAANKMPTNYVASRPVFLRYLKLASQHQLLSLSMPSDTWVRQVGQTLAMHWRSQLLETIRPLDITKAENYTKIGFVTRDLALLLCGAQQGLYDYPSGPIEQLEGAHQPYSQIQEMRNTFLRRFRAEEYVLITERLSPGHVDKFTYATQPAFNVLGKHIQNVDAFICKLKEPRDPVSQYLWSSLPEMRDTLMAYVPSTYLLMACDFTQPAALANLLSAPTGQSSDALTLYLWNRFSGFAQRKLTDLSTTDYELRWTLSSELNDIINGPSIYETQRFRGIGVSIRANALLARNPQGAELKKLNRWLLEDAFPTILKSPDRPTSGLSLETTKVTIANALHSLIQGPSIYTADRFAGVRLSPETQELLVQTPSGAGNALHLNRRLLEDVFPNELPRADVQVMQVYYPALELLRAPMLDDPLQCGADFETTDAQQREVLDIADNEFLTQRLSGAETRLLQTGTSGDLQGAIKLLKELIWLAGWAEKKQLPAAAQIPKTLKKLTFEFTEIAEARKAWWYLHEYTDILIEAAESSGLAGADIARAAILAEANNALRASGRLLSSFSQLLPGQKPVDLPLPGDIYINRVFGEVTYRRDTRELSGTFGGRVEFPDLQNAFFEISNATLDSHLDFSIAAATAGPLPFDGAWVTATMSASGGTNRPLLFAGTGTLSLTNGPDLAVTLSLDTGTRTLSFDTAVTDLEDWRLTDDLVLFDAGFGFSVSPITQNGELRANGAAGFFAKSTLPGTNHPLSRTNFHLFAENVRAAVQFQPDQVRFTFSNGTLHLPPFFYPTNMESLCPGMPGAATGPTIALNSANPIQATVHLTLPPALPSVDFSGELDFRHFGLAVPGIPGLAAAICSARLVFSDEALPFLTNVNATLQIPLPRSTNNIDLEDGVFTLTGYPSGRLELRQDLPLLDLSGFKVIVLGQGHAECPQGSGLTVFPSVGFQQLPAFQIDGGLRVEAPASMLSGVSNDTAYGLACGGISITNGQFPRLSVDALQFGGTFHLGGPSGLLLSNALISLEGIENILNPSQANPFIARIGGSMIVPNGPGFTLSNAMFRFFDPDRLPKFSVDGMGFDLTGFDLVQGLPAAIDRAAFTFKDPQLELPYLLSPTNVTLSMSAHVSIPPGDEKFIGGRIDNVRMTVTPTGFLQIQSVAGLLLEIGSVSIPPLEEIGGKLYIGGLENLNPSEMYFVGRGAGSYQGYKLKLLMAFNLAGPIGMCLDVNAGAAGIPLGQSTFLFTGAGGGVSFLNNGEDPCEFTTYVDPEGKPLSSVIGGFPLPNVMSWESLKATMARMERTAAAYANNLPPMGGGAAGLSNTKDLPLMANGFDCPGGCPPPTVNIFCQPHPAPDLYPNRVIMKFTAIDEPTLNNVFHITPENMNLLGGNATMVATNFARQVRLFVETNIPPFDIAFPGDTNAIRAAIRETLDAMETTFSASIYFALSNVPPSTFYPIIRDIAFVGAPCPDITMKVFGTFSQAAVSSFLSATVGGQITSAGNAGVFGNINLLGFPVGKGKIFVAATDDRGQPNPSACGEIECTFGPLELGLMRGEMSCRDCVTGILREFYKLAQCLSEPVLRQLASNAAPRLAALNLPPEQVLNQMSDVEKIGFMAELYQLPPGVIAGLPQCFITQFRQAIDVFQPYMVLCGVAEPRIFGLPLGDRLVEISAEVSKTNIAGLMSYSPSRMLMYAINAATTIVRSLFPFEDTATFGFNFKFPDPAQALLAGMDGKLSSSNAIAAYAAEQFDHMLQNSTYTSQFELKPLGGKGLDTQARIILPNLTNHPARPGSSWIRPEYRGTGYISRADILLKSLEGGRLANPFWSGTAGELAELFDNDPRLHGLDLRKDYFPHGGYVGGAYLAMPKALTEPPPDYLPGLLNPNSDMTPVDRLLNTLDYLQNYLTSFTNRGSLAFYVPAPNPPFFTNSSGQDIGAQEMIRAISSFDFKSITNAQVASLYPAELVFVKGYFNATLLGVPMSTGIVEVIPPGTTNPEAIFRLEVAGTPEGWLSHFVKTNSLVFDMRGSPPRPMEAWANEAFLDFAELSLNPDGLSQTAFEDLIRQRTGEFVDSFRTNLPKVKLQSDLQLVLPGPISNLVAFTAGAQLHAYSPMFEPEYNPADLGPVARVRREGGLAFQGSALFKAGPITLVEVSNAEFSVVPRGDGIPAISARFNAPVVPVYYFLTFQDVQLDVANEPNAHISASGTVVPFAIGNFNIAPGSGLVLGGGFNVSSSGGSNVSFGIHINPAELLCPVISYTDKLLIHGPTQNDPFTFSTTGPWTASLELTNKLNLLNVVELGGGGLLAPITLSGNGTNSATFTIGFGPGAGLTLFPADANLRRNLTLQAGVNGSVSVSSAGRFLLTTTLGGSGLSFNNISAPAGATLTASNEGISISWFINNGAASASLSISSNGNIAFSGSTELPPLNFGIFQLTGANGGNLQGAFNNDGFALNAGALLKLNADWLQNQALAVTALTISNNGGMRITVTNSPGSLIFAGYPFDLTSFTFARAPTNGGSGVATFSMAGLLRTSPNFVGFPSLTFTGSISSAGEVFLQNSAAAPTFFGFPVRNLTNTLTVAAAQYAADIQSRFQLGSGAGNWAALGANQFTGAFASDGSFSFSADAPALTLSAFPLSNTAFRMTRHAGAASGVSLEATLALAGYQPLRLSGSFDTQGGYLLTLQAPAPGAPLPYPNLNANMSLTLTNPALYARGTLNQSPLPSMSVTGVVENTGAFALTGVVANATINGYGFSSGTYQVIRAAGGGTYVAATGALNVPGFPSQNLSGSFTNDGTFLLTGSVANPALNGALPMPAFNGLANWKFAQNELALAGSFSPNAGVLASVLLAPSTTATGLVSIATSGAQTLRGNISIQPVTNGFFRITNGSGGNFIAKFENAGLRITGSPVLSYSNYFAAPLPLPEILIGANGDFLVTAGSPVPLSFLWNGFSLDNVSLTLRRTGTLISVSSFDGSFNVPNLNRAVHVGGSMANDGTFLLTGAFQGAADLRGITPSLPVSTLGSDATLAFTHNSLTAAGSLAGGVLSVVPLSGNASGTLTITPSTVTLGGSIRLSPLDLGAFRIESTAPDGSFNATWSNNQLMLPAGLRVTFNGSVLASGLAQIPVNANGSFNFSRTNVSFMLGGFSITGANFSFSRSGGGAAVSVSLANLNVTNLTPALQIGVSGSLRSDGTYSLESLVNAGGTFGYGSPLLVNVGGGVHVLLENGTATVDGTLSGGVLGFVSVVGSAGGGFRITALPSVSVSAFGSVTHSALDFGVFDIVPVDGGNFISTLDSAGLHLPSEAHLYFDNAPLGNFLLPPITIPPSGNYSGAMNNVAWRLIGFDLTGVNFTFQKNGSGFSLPSFSGTLRVPGLGLNVPLSGAIPSTGLFQISNSSLGSPALPNLPPGNFAANATLRLVRTAGSSSLSIDGNVTGGILDVVPELSAVAQVTIGTDGALGIFGTNNLDRLAAGPFTIESSSGGTLSATWNNNGLTVASSRLRFANFNANIPLPSFTIPRNGNLTLGNISPGALNLMPSSANIPFQNVTMSVRRTPTTIDIPSWRAQLNVPLLTDKWFAGSIGSGGSFNLQQDVAGLVLGTFNASLGRLSMTGISPTLLADGIFSINVLGRDLGSVTFRGNVQANGNYILNSAGSWSLGNFIGVNSGNAWFNSLGNGSGGSLTLANGGLSGSDTLSYGSTTIPINISSCTAGGGISFSGTRNFHTFALRFLDAVNPPPPPGPYATVSCVAFGDVYGDVNVDVSLNANNSNGSFSANVGGQFGWWVINDNTSCTTEHTWSSNPYTPYYRYCQNGPYSLPDIPSNQRANVPSVGINSDGYLCVNQNQGGQPSFYFKLWPAPGLGSSNGRCP